MAKPPKLVHLYNYQTMNFIYFHTSTTETIEAAISDGVPVICSGGARDFPGTRRGILWDVCQGPRGLEVQVRKDRSNTTSEDIVSNIDGDREQFLGEDAIEIEDFS